VEAVVVVTSTGRPVGRLVPGTPTLPAGVLVSVDGKTLVLPLGFDNELGQPLRSAGLRWAVSSLQFLQPECKGTAHIATGANPPGGSRWVAVTRDGARYVAHVGASAAVTGTVRSQRDPSTGQCRGPFSAPTQLAPVESTVSLDAYGTGPFQLR
jgi:hypothetical protein